MVLPATPLMSLLSDRIGYLKAGIGVTAVPTYIGRRHLMLYRHRRRFLGDQILHVRHVSYLFVYDIYERLHLNAIAAINVVQSRRISV